MGCYGEFLYYLCGKIQGLHYYFMGRWRCIYVDVGAGVDICWEDVDGWWQLALVGLSHGGLTLYYGIFSAINYWLHLGDQMEQFYLSAQLEIPYT